MRSNVNVRMMCVGVAILLLNGFVALGQDAVFDPILGKLRSRTSTGTATNCLLLQGKNGSYYLLRANHTGVEPIAAISGSYTGLTGVGIVTVGVWRATAVADGFFVKTGDWTGTFDGIEGAAVVQTSRTVTVSAPLSGGGALSANIIVGLTNSAGAAVTNIPTTVTSNDTSLATGGAIKRDQATATALWNTRDKVEAVWPGVTTIWCDDNDGTGSGLDADLLDGNEATAFGKLAAANTWTATNTFPIQTGTYATTNTLTATQMRGAIIYVTGAATLTLPAVSPGDHVTIITIGAVAVSVDPNGSDKIYLDGVALDDGDKITNNSAAGNIAVITYYSADGWHASTDGWTDGN